MIEISCATERFWKHTKITDGCWEWLSTKNKQGYGRIQIQNERVFAHRLSWYIHTGENPGDLCVLHRCDNPSCVNPKHLFLGTRKDNAYDMISKGRKVQLSKLTEKDVLEIRAVKPFHTYRELSHLYGVARQTVKDLCLRKRWRHI